jgi:hypothetical protein
MIVTRLIAAPAQPVPTDAVFAPVVMSKVRVYSIKTQKSRAEVEGILQGLVTSQPRHAFTSGFGSIMESVSAAGASDREDVLSRIGEIERLADARMEGGRAGEQASLFVGEEIPYVKSFESVGTERSNEVLDIVRAGLTLGVKSAIQSDGSVHMIVAHMITEIENTDGLETGAAVIRLPRASQASVVFAASLQTGQSVIYVEFDRPGSPFGADAILVTMITPEVVN